MSRGRKFTRAELESDHRRLKEENGLLHRALQDVCCGEQGESVRSETEKQGGYYIFHLLRPTAPDGGMVLATYCYPGQRDYTVVHWAEEMLMHDVHLRWPPSCWAAIDRLRIARNKACDALVAREIAS